MGIHDSESTEQRQARELTRQIEELTRLRNELDPSYAPQYKPPEPFMSRHFPKLYAAWIRFKMAVIDVEYFLTMAFFYGIILLFGYVLIKTLLSR